jgi:hypothetical protein
VSSEQLRAVFENVVLAEYHCRYDWRDRQVTDIHAGVFYHTRVTSPQGARLPLTPQDSVVLYRARPPRRRKTFPAWSSATARLTWESVPIKKG